jgi:hypothetical protein
MKFTQHFKKSLKLCHVFNNTNLTWSKAFDEMAKTVNQAELTQQCTNHVLDYTGEANGVFMSLSKNQQDDVYEILNQIL